jgi:hypothetical protein
MKNKDEPKRDLINQTQPQSNLETSELEVYRKNGEK